jgi:hypothetical protein
MGKRNKIDVLIDIIRLNEDLNELKEELFKFSFDSKIPLIYLNKIDLYFVINK